jgi:hypothetical protein
MTSSTSAQPESSVVGKPGKLTVACMSASSMNETLSWPTHDNTAHQFQLRPQCIVLSGGRDGRKILEISSMKIMIGRRWTIVTTNRNLARSGTGRLAEETPYLYALTEPPPRLIFSSTCMNGNNVYARVPYRKGRVRNMAGVSWISSLQGSKQRACTRLIAEPSRRLGMASNAGIGRR